MRLSLEQRRMIRFDIQQIVTMAMRGDTPKTTIQSYIETTLDNIDYMEPPRWQQRLRERMN